MKKVKSNFRRYLKSDHIQVIPYGKSMQQQSLFIEDNGHNLHLRHISQANAAVPILMVHGAVENGKIFYTEKGKGFMEGSVFVPQAP